MQPETVTIATDSVYRLFIQRHALETGEKGRVLESVHVGVCLPYHS